MYDVYDGHDIWDDSYLVLLGKLLKRIIAGSEQVEWTALYVVFADDLA